MGLEVEADGAQRFPHRLDSNALEALKRLLPGATGPGERIFSNPSLAAWLATGPVAANVRDILGEMAQPVRAILFDKTHEANWALPWHQDRTIAVRQRVETEGFLNWNSKSGAVHVEPPFNFIENMLTARIHLDPVPETNAPLLIAPGSHRLGRIPEGNIERVAEQCGSFACVANAGDVWLYRTAILHASDAVRQPGRRRVLQVDYAAEELPGELRWLGVG